MNSLTRSDGIKLRSSFIIINHNSVQNHEEKGIWEIPGKTNKKLTNRRTLHKIKASVGLSQHTRYCLHFTSCHWCTELLR